MTEPYVPKLDEGWLPWAGGDCPVPPETRVEVKFRDGYTDSQGCSARGLFWDHKNGTGDIVAYRFAEALAPAPPVSGLDEIEAAAWRFRYLNPPDRKWTVVHDKPPADAKSIEFQPLFSADTTRSLISRIRTDAAEIAKLETVAREMTKALTGLTANGSEYFTRVGEFYYADSEKCVAYIRQRHETLHANFVEAVTARKAAESTVTTLKEKLSRAEEALKTCNCPRPANSRPDEETVETCVAAGLCGCSLGAALTPETDNG